MLCVARSKPAKSASHLEEYLAVVALHMGSLASAINILLLLVWLAGIIKEIAIMRMLQDHPNVVKLQDVFEDDTHFYLVMELCSGGELFDQIISKGHFTERDAAVIMRALLDVMAFAHSKHIVHRCVAFACVCEAGVVWYADVSMVCVCVQMLFADVCSSKA